MKWGKVKLPEKTFGIDTALLVVFMPLLLVVLMVIISFNLVIVRKWGDYQEMRTQLTGIEGQTKLLTDKRNYLQSIDQEELLKNERLIDSALLPQKNAYLLVGVVRKIADKYGYQLDSFVIRPGELTAEEDEKMSSGVAKIPISLTLAGPSEKYTELIDGLERSLPILSLEGMEMQNSLYLTKMTMQISAYYIGDKMAVDINKLSLADLTLKKEESELLSTLGGYTLLEEVGQIEEEMGGVKEYIEYDRTDPFNP